MFGRECNRILCILSGLLGLILVGLGVFLLATGFPLLFVTIGTFVAGLLLLFYCCFARALRVPWLLCVLLTLITLFLIIAGILTIVFLFAIAIGVLLISLGVLTLLLTVICLICHLCFEHHDEGGPCNCY